MYLHFTRKKNYILAILLESLFSIYREIVLIILSLSPASSVALFLHVKQKQIFHRTHSRPNVPFGGGLTTPYIYIYIFNFLIKYMTRVKSIVGIF
jgi:hypothetical protein